MTFTGPKVVRMTRQVPQSGEMKSQESVLVSAHCSSTIGVRCVSHTLYGVFVKIHCVCCTVRS